MNSERILFSADLFHPLTCNTQLNQETVNIIAIALVLGPIYALGVGRLFHKAIKELLSIYFTKQTTRLTRSQCNTQ